MPLLVIDDEADNASINTKPIPVDPMTGTPLDDYDVTAINGRIRQLLTLFFEEGVRRLHGHSLRKHLHPS